MINWTIFLLHFCAAVFYVCAGENSTKDNGMGWAYTQLIFAVILTATAAWI
jgi:hypothetical protein